MLPQQIQTTSALRINADKKNQKRQIIICNLSAELLQNTFTLTVYLRFKKNRLTSAPSVTAMLVFSAAMHWSFKKKGNLFCVQTEKAQQVEET